MQHQSKAQRIVAFRRAIGGSIKESQKYLETLPEALIEKILRADDIREDPSSALVDPLETDPKFAKVISEIHNTEQTNVMIEHDGEWQRGTCYLIWSRMKKRLKVENGLDWSSPHELNPNRAFD